MMLLTYMSLLTFWICAAIKNESTEICFTIKPQNSESGFKILYKIFEWLLFHLFSWDRLEKLW